MKEKSTTPPHTLPTESHLAKDPMGRVAADGEAGADYASHTEGGGRGYELVTVSPEAWAIIWMKSVDEITE